MTLLLTLGIFALFMLSMAIGYLLVGKALQGSCGGLSKLPNLSCLFCRRSKREECKTLRKC